MAAAFLLVNSFNKQFFLYVIHIYDEGFFFFFVLCSVLRTAVTFTWFYSFYTLHKINKIFHQGLIKWKNNLNWRASSFTETFKTTSRYMVPGYTVLFFGVLNSVALHCQRHPCNWFWKWLCFGLDLLNNLRCNYTFCKNLCVHSGRLGILCCIAVTTRASTNSNLKATLSSNTGKLISRSKNLDLQFAKYLSVTNPINKLR